MSESNDIAKVKVKLLYNDNNIIPRKAHDHDVGYDLRAYKILKIVPMIDGLDQDFYNLNYPVYLKPGYTYLVSTGLSIELPFGYESQIRSRSGLALKDGIIVANSPGTIECTYRGEYGVILRNTSNHDFELNKYDRIAQLVIAKVPDTEIELVDELSETERGSCGFGSTGFKRDK